MEEQRPSPEHFYSRRRVVFGTLWVAVLIAAVPALVVWFLVGRIAGAVVFVGIVAVWSLAAAGSEVNAKRHGVDLSPTLDPADPRAQTLMERYLADKSRTGR